MKFPSRLLVANMTYALMLWAGFLALVAAVTAVIAILGTLDQSIWEQATQVVRWYGLFVGVALVWEFMPLYLAHGRTRRQFGGHAAITATLFAPFLSALIVIGYLIEAGLYRLAGLPQSLIRPHLFTAPTQVPMVFAEHTLAGLTWIAVGAFAAAAFYRWRGGGVLSVPVGVALVALAESALGSGLRLPLIWDHIEMDLSPLPAAAVGITLGAYLVGLILTWGLIRDVPLRNKVS
jgi:hypothetical protein